MKLAGLLLCLALLAAPAVAEPFTRQTTLERVLADPDRFLDDYVRHEAPFFRIARHPQSALTCDGWDLDPRTGQPVKPRYWSAPSKECLDVALLVKAVEQDRRALMLVSREEAVEILRRKLQSYLDYHRRYPLAGGWMPWYYGGHQADPAPGWEGNLPGLDNGEWVFALLVAEKVLRDRGYVELARGYREFLDLLETTAVPVFYDFEVGLVRGDVALSPDGYRTDPGRASHLTGEHGVHEGLMFVMFVTLFGRGLPEDAPGRIWAATRMVRVEHPVATTWQGFWGSAHESWAYLFLPYRDLPEYRELFRLREIIRTRNAAQRGYCGLHASIHDPVTMQYVSNCGIEGIGTQPIKYNHALALYGAFPVLLADRRAGAAWLYNMLDAPRMLGPLGGGESISNDGRHFAPVKTIDGTFPILLAAMGGLEKETAAMLKERGLYQQFCEILREEYREAFGDAPLRCEADFALPPHPVPRELEDFD
ncbi:MAG: hypothetical protein AB1758_09140 [Candidatus Eremiobacterota bacterium]